MALGRTKRELLASIDSAELTEWAAFDLVEPFGGKRGDFQAGIVAATIHNYSGHATKGKSPFDYMPFYQTATPKMTPLQILAKARQITQILS